MSKYRIKKVTDVYGCEIFMAQVFTAPFRWFGVWVDISQECPSFEVANSFIEVAIYRDSLKGAKKTVEFLEPNLPFPEL